MDLHGIASKMRKLEAASSQEHKQKWGQYFTPSSVAAFMASLIELDPAISDPVRILDPGAGTGILGIAAAIDVLRQTERPVRLVSVETEPEARMQLMANLDSLKGTYSDRVQVEVLDADFLELANPKLGQPVIDLFDVVISNPPYYKMSPKDPRGGDAPNIYARFMEVSANLLRAEGQLVFIIPRSFASGYYFRRFRRRFHRRMSVHQVHVFDSRRDVFDGVLQESIVVRYLKSTVRPAHVGVSSSQGAHDLDDLTSIRVPSEDVISPGDRREVLSLPTSPRELELLEQVHGWSESLDSLGLKISTGPVVAFRARSEILREPNGTKAAPLLWMNHVKPGRVTWPLPSFRKPQHIRVSAPEKLLVPRGNYCVLRRFSAKEEKRRLTAAHLLASDLGSHDVVGMENHLNFIHKPGGSMTPEEAAGFCVLLCSTALDQFFRISSGNTQVSATEIRAMPLPRRSVIERMGARYLADPDQDFDTLMIEEFPWAESMRPRLS